MKHWPLRSQLTLWSALLVAAILVVIGGGIAIYLQRQEIAELDEQLQLISKHFLAEYRENGENPEWVTPRTVESTITETGSREWFIEITDVAGVKLYRSPGLANRTLAAAPPGIADFDLDDDGLRCGTFSGKGIILRVAADMDAAEELSSNMLIAAAVVFPAVFAIIFFGARWLARRALTPVGALTDAAEQVTAHRLTERLPVPATGDELSRLAIVLNAMFDRLAAAFSQATRFSADASHEFKTPIAIARAGLETVLASPTLAEPDREIIADSLDQLRRITSITQTLLLLSRADGGQLEMRATEGDLAACLRGSFEDAEVLGEMRGLKLTLECPVNVPAFFDKDRTTIILQNLLENAVKHNRDGGTIHIHLTASQTSATIEIANTGVGISAEHRPQLFQRFFRAGASSDTAGHGLGLSLARELARAQGGDVALGTSGNQWTAFLLTVPTSREGRGEQTK